MHELVSAIITTCMRPPEIVFRAVNSALKQTYPNMEIIVVDDSPAAYTHRDILSQQLCRLGRNVTYIPHDTNKGACAARNTGLQAARGRYVAFLDDDDEWLPTKIERQIQKFTDDQTALVYCGKLVVDDASGSESQPHVPFHTGYVFDTLIYDNFIGSASFSLLRKDFLEEAGGFDPQMASAQDYDVWLRLAQRYKVDYIAEPLVKYHIHEGERISTNHQARISGQERLIQKNMDYLMQNPRAFWWRRLRLSLQYAQAAKLQNALALWCKACGKQPQAIVTNLNYLARILYYSARSKLSH